MVARRNPLRRSHRLPMAKSAARLFTVPDLLLQLHVQQFFEIEKRRNIELEVCRDFHSTQIIRHSPEACFFRWWFM